MAVFSKFFHHFGPHFLWALSCLGRAQSYYVHRVSSVSGHIDAATKGLPPSPRFFMKTQIMPRGRNVSQENLPLTKESASFCTPG